ncbi:MAG: hypothetical protein KAV40_05365 [Thermoplasmatales archaeon]|nr:hypothetical protein [Thermoplasmatales archaeon]
MKNLNKILITGVVILFLFSAVAASMNLGYNTESESLEDIILNFTFSKPKIEKIEVNNEICDRVTINGLPNSGELNQPRLPVKSVKLLMPYGGELDFVNIVAKEKSLVGSGYNVEIGHNIIPLESNAAPQDSNGKHDSISPEKVYSIVGTHTFRGHTVLFVNLYPVQYTEDTGEIAYYKHITLEVKTKESLANTFIRGLQKDKDIVTKLVDNPSCIMSYNDAPVSTGRDTVEYVIITNEELKDATGDYTFQDLVQSKIDKGMSADIFTAEDIVNNSNYSVNGTWGDNNPDNPFYKSVITANFSRFNDTQAKIRNFIRYAYTKLGTDYVLLGGDADVAVPEDNIIPLRGLYACEEGLPLDTGTLDFEEDDIPSDVYYACLDGNYNYDMDERWGENATNNNISNVEEADLLAEIYVGRACVDADDEVSNFVMKTLAYENSDEEPYLVKALMVGEYLGFPGVSVYGGNYKDLIIPLIPDDYYVDTLYEREGHWGKSDIINILNTATPHLLNHLGHGFVDYALKLGNSDILSLTNDKYFFIYSQTCLAGSFDNCYRETYYMEDCAAEHFTVETPHGAFAVIMNARFGLGSEDTLYSPSQVLDESFFTALFNESIRELGRANHYSKEDHIWHINENGIRWVYYETNLFGDPEVSIKDPCPSSVVFNITFTCPENTGSLYVLGKKIFPLLLIKVPFLIGRTTMQVEAISDPEGQVFSVEFYIDNESQHVDYEAPYEYNLNTFLVGRHTVTAEVHGIYGGKESKSIDIITFILGK